MTFVFRASEMCRWDARGNLKTIATETNMKINCNFRNFFFFLNEFHMKNHTETMLIARWIDAFNFCHFRSGQCVEYFVLYSCLFVFLSFILHGFFFYLHSVEIAWKSVRTKYRLPFIVERFGFGFIFKSIDVHENFDMFYIFVFNYSVV